MSAAMVRRVVRLTEILARKADMDQCLAAGRVSETPGEPVWLRIRADERGLELCDGHHRVAAAIRAGRPSILADIDLVPDDEPLDPPFYDFGQRTR